MTTSGASRSPHVLLVLATSQGGVARHVEQVVRSLTADGTRVSLAAPPAVLSAFGFTATDARVFPVAIGERPDPVADARAAKRLAKLAEEVDVVHAHGLRAGALVVLALRGARPTAVTLHNAVVARGWRGLAVRAVYAVLERVVARGADIALGVSADLESRLRQLGARDVRHAVVPAPAALAARSTPARTRMSLEVADRALLVCVARLAEQKGLSTLLDAVSLLMRTSPRQVLAVVAGDGPQRAVLQARVDSERLPVRLLGWRDDVGDLLQAADVVVSAAVWEGQPVAVQQALQAGAAIVATDVGGTREVTGDAAVLVPASEPAQLAEAVQHLLMEPGLAADLRALARRRAQELPQDQDALVAARDLYADLLRIGAKTGYSKSPWRRRNTSS